jgi:transcriptional regulator with XRE-family HTH domain
MQEENLSFGDWLRQRRKLLDLTQQELADQVGCSVETVRKIEGQTRRPSRQLAAIMAIHLQIPVTEQAAFVEFARLGSRGQNFPLPVWKPDDRTWRVSQLPLRRPTERSYDRVPADFDDESASKKRMVANYQIIPRESPLIEYGAEGSAINKVLGEGPVQGDIEGQIDVRITQLITRKHWRHFAKAVAVFFNIETNRGQIEGSYTGDFFVDIDETGNGTARIIAAGYVISVSPEYSNFFLARVNVESTVQIVEGGGTGEAGTMTFSLR